jgi:H+-transporting ATPase
MNAVIGIGDAQESSVERLVEMLSTTTRGLSDSEAQRRIATYGFNEIAEKKIHPLKKFLLYFWGPIPWLIEVAIVLSAIIGRWDDLAIIAALLLLNAMVGFWQERKADTAIEFLKQRLAPHARVMRDGIWKEVPARDLVPGDVVRVRLGDIVPADSKLFGGEYLILDESALTGESLPVEKHPADIAYEGAIVRQGEMDALVYATGMQTYFGRTAGLVSRPKKKSHFQKAVVKIGDYLIALAVFCVSVVFLVSLFRHESFVETLTYVLVLTVAAIPAALPAVLSVSMAVGAMALAKKEAIVSSLESIEEAAGMDILCSDKTGTITRNEIAVAAVVPLEGYTEHDVLLLATLASREEDRDPIDTAIIGYSRAIPAITDMLEGSAVLDFHPFDPVAKRTEADLRTREGTRFTAAKGAPQVILSLLPSPGPLGDRILEEVDGFAARGYRALGVARTDGEGAWHMAGLIALYDPPREDSSETIRTARAMGVAVKMITGDHTAIAREIAREVDLAPDIRPAASFLESPEGEAARVAEEADGFAEVFPEHKYRIVELLQGRGHIVGMTGDGVNDAPALKRADVGFAVAGATDAAKSAADIVLTKPGLSVIIDTIQESRRIFQRMQNYSIYRIAETIRVLFFISLSIIIFRFFPITALMIVLLALLNDAAIMTIAYDNVRYSGVPERWDMRILLGISTMLGLTGVIESFGLLYIGLEYLHLSHAALQSFIYLKLSVAGHLTVFLARTRGPFWSVRPALPLVAAVLGTQAIATLIAVYGILIPAIGWQLAAFVWAYALIMFVIIDRLKIGFYRILDHTGIRFRRSER